MHEMALSESVMQILESNARTRGFRRVKTVWLEIGELAAVEPQAMYFAFDAISRGTIADGAVLEIVDRPGQAWCPQCEADVHVSTRFDPCPGCGCYPLTVTGGEELRVKELEVV